LKSEPLKASAKKTAFNNEGRFIFPNSFLGDVENTLKISAGITPAL
jgi:hypothetical protein